MARSDVDHRRRTSPPGLEGAIAALAARQHGVVTGHQLAALGLGPSGVQHRATVGRLHRVHRGVYAVGHPVLVPDGHRLAAVLACGAHAVLSHHTAAVLWGLRSSGGGAPHVTTTDRGRRGPDDVHLHRTRTLRPADVTLHRGIPVTTVARTLVDLAATGTPADRLERDVHESVVLGLFDRTALLDALARAPGRSGARTLRAALAEPDPGTTRSALERRFLGLCRRHGLPIPRLNVHVEAGGRPVEVDALWPAARVVVELDGRATHDTARAFHADRRRDADLAAEGHVVVRLTWHRVTREPAQVAGQLRRILDLRGGTI